MQKNDGFKIPPVFILILIAALLFIPFLGNVHLFDRDEINFAEIAREMVISNNYSEPQINFETFAEKPPLYFWLQAACMNLFGINEFSTRLPNALLGVLVLPILFAIGKKIKSKSFGFLWAMVYAGTVLPHLYFKSGIIDPWFNFFIFLSLYCLVMAAAARTEKKSNVAWLISGGVLLGLAILTKGPASLLILGITFLVYWASQKFKSFMSLPQLFLFGFSALFTAGLWLGFNYTQHGDAFIKEFFIRQWELLTTSDAGHGGFFLYHFVILFFGCFPATAFFLQTIFKKEKDKFDFYDFKKWMTILFWVVLILFTLVKTKIVHYSSLCYFPLSFLAALSIHNIITNKWQLTRWMKTILVVSGIPFVLTPFAAAFFGSNIDQLKPLLRKDVFVMENLQASVYWSGWEFLPGLLLLVVIIVSFIYFRKQQNLKAAYLLFGGTAIFIQLTLFFLIGRIEGYSQRANIEFWKSHANEDCYFTSYHYKTYTHYFYGQVKPQSNKNYKNENWLLTGELDKPVYISCRVKNKMELEQHLPDAKFLYSSNGFYFYKRETVLK